MTKQNRLTIDSSKLKTTAGAWSANFVRFLRKIKHFTFKKRALERRVGK